MLLLRSALLFALALAACSTPDPLARQELRDLDRTWAEIQAGVRDDDADRIQAVAAPAADAGIGRRVLVLLTSTDSGRAIRQNLLDADLSALEVFSGEIAAHPMAPGRILAFESSVRTPAEDGFPPSDSGLTFYIQLDDGQARLLDTLVWSRVVRGDAHAAAPRQPPQTPDELWTRLVAALDARDEGALATLLDPRPDDVEPAELAQVPAMLLRWAYTERYADAFRAALRASGPPDMNPSDGSTPRVAFVEAPGDTWPANFVYVVQRDEGVFIEGALERIHPDADRAALRATWPGIVQALRDGDASALAALTAADADEGVERLALAAYGPGGLERDNLAALARARVEAFSRETVDDGRVVYSVIPDLSAGDASATVLFLTIVDGRAVLFRTLAVG